MTIVVVTKLKESGGKVSFCVFFQLAHMHRYCDLQTKCSCYWPALKQKDCFRDITVTFEDELVFSEYTVRIFQLTV